MSACLTVDPTAVAQYNKTTSHALLLRHCSAAAPGLRLLRCCCWHVRCCVTVRRWRCWPVAAVLLLLACCCGAVAVVLSLMALLLVACRCGVVAAVLSLLCCCWWPVGAALLLVACRRSAAAAGLSPQPCCCWPVAAALLLLACRRSAAAAARMSLDSFGMAL